MSFDAERPDLTEHSYEGILNVCNPASHPSAPEAVVQPFTSRSYEI
jgi:hypothetical protein